MTFKLLVIAVDRMTVSAVEDVLSSRVSKNALGPGLDSADEKAITVCEVLALAKQQSAKDIKALKKKL